MLKIKLSKLIKNNFFSFLLLLIILTTILITNFYSINKKNQQQELLNFTENIYLKKSIINIISNLKPKYSHKEITVKKGDTFEKIISNLNLDSKEKEIIVNNLSKFKIINKLYKGQKISFKIDNSNSINITQISIEKSKTKTIIFNRIDGLNKFKFREIDKNLKKINVYKESIITNSLYSSAIALNINPNIIIDFAQIYGFQIDFQRDIWKNDSFQIIYESFLDSNDKIVENGKILYANLILKGKDNNLYVFKTKDGFEYFDNSGKSVKKSLMKTPINGARLSSSFGMRKHPILGYNKMHKGTDFAAPEGTPIMASGDGKIVRARWCGGGGNCIKIYHNSSYSTVYAHLKNFARGIKEGVKVKQGQTIGYVGSTGKSTGPHLHYEVIINGKKVNSQTLKLPSGKILKNEERKSFEIQRIKTDVLIAEMIEEKK